MKTKTVIFIENSKDSVTDAINLLAKVMSVPFRLQGRRPSGFEKNLHASLRSGSIFSKNLACGGTLIEKPTK